MEDFEIIFFLGVNILSELIEFVLYFVSNGFIKV